MSRRFSPFHIHTKKVITQREGTKESGEEGSFGLLLTRHTTRGNIKICPTLVDSADDSVSHTLIGLSLITIIPPHFCL